MASVLGGMHRRDDGQFVELAHGRGRIAHQPVVRVDHVDVVFHQDRGGSLLHANVELQHPREEILEPDDGWIFGDADDVHAF